MEHNTKKRIKILAVILLGLILCIEFVVNHIQPFLSINQPIQAKILVIEGWIPDFALKKATDYFSDDYELIITTGGPIRIGSHLVEYKTYAALAKSTIEIISNENSIVAVPARYVQRDRTYASALALKRWLLHSNIKYQNINVIALDVHARRTKFLFQKALGDSYSVGIIAIDDIRYDSEKWWRSSNGFREVLDETIAYLYVILFFSISDDISD
jgi:hypothetical protein